MRTLFAILFAALPVLAQLPSAPSLLDPAGLPEQPASSGVTYLFQETFDATGFDIAGWTESFPSETKEDWTTAPAPLEGAQSLYFDVTATRSIDTTNFTASATTLWLSFLWHNNEGTLPAAIRTPVTFKHAIGGTTLATMQLETDGDVTVLNGTASNRSTDSLATNLTYRVWFQYAPGTGANGTAAIYWTTNLSGSKGSAKCSVSSGTSQTNAVSIRFVGYTDLEWHLDDIKVSETEH